MECGTAFALVQELIYFDCCAIHPIEEEVALEVGGEQFTIWQGDGASGLLACGGAG